MDKEQLLTIATILWFATAPDKTVIAFANDLECFGYFNNKTMTRKQFIEASSEIKVEA